MQAEKIIDLISKGRTDFIFQLLQLHNWKDLLNEGQVRLLQWLVYYNDTTALKAVVEAGGNLDSINLNGELGNAAFFGHWKVCDFLISYGADKEAKDANGDSPLSWASEHLRPGFILSLLTYGNYRISEAYKTRLTSDHGQGWGNSMDWKLFGDYLLE